MDSGKIFGSDEDSRSCGESGWTTYLVSNHDHDYDNYSDDADSSGGDSLDSDASSGPVKATPCLQLSQETTEPNCLKKKKKANEEKVLVETRVHNDNDDDGDNHDYDDGENPDHDDVDDHDDGDNHDYDDGNDSHSAVHSYVGSVTVRQDGLL